MADVKKMATRDGYGKGLVELGKEHADIVVLDADLAGSTKTGMFAKAYPDRHFNCGIAEGQRVALYSRSRIRTKRPCRRNDGCFSAYLLGDCLCCRRFCGRGVCVLTSNEKITIKNPFVFT